MTTKSIVVEFVQGIETLPTDDGTESVSAAILRFDKSFFLEGDNALRIRSFVERLWLLGVTRDIGTVLAHRGDLDLAEFRILLNDESGMDEAEEGAKLLIERMFGVDVIFVDPSVSMMLDARIKAQLYVNSVTV